MILFFGNLLSEKGLNPTAIEDLISSLSGRYEIECASSKKNLFYRLINMLTLVIKYRNNCKLMIIDVFSTKAILFAVCIVFFAKLFKTPYFLVLRGGYLPGRYKKNPYIINFLFSDATKIISPSKYLQKSFNKTNFPITVIPNYIDLEKYSFTKRENIKPNLFWVRSIHPIYNPMMAIEVLDKVRTKYPEACLCMVGPVKDIQIMKELNNKICKLGLEKNVLFTGYLSKTKWSELSKKYDIFLNTTDYDNNPVTLLESMALGMPIVSTNVGGIPHLIQDNFSGLLVQKNNPLHMVKKINDLISGKVDAKKIVQNSNTYVFQFDKKKIIDQWCRLIDDFI